MADDEPQVSRLSSIDRAIEEEAAPVPRRPDLISVVVPCPGQLEYVRLCVPSLLRHSRPPYELIFVDVDSLDGTAEFLDGTQVAAPIRLQIVHAREEAGLAAACDAGIARARGRYVAVLSSDTVATAGWLDHLSALAESDPSIGAVGPMANLASPAQRVSPVPYRLRVDRVPSESRPTTEALDLFADQWRREHKGQWFEAEVIDPFCVLFRRETLESVGPLAELVNPSVRPSQLQMFDSARLARKLRQAGYRLACCRDLYLHHFASRAAVPTG